MPSRVAKLLFSVLVIWLLYISLITAAMSRIQHNCEGTERVNISTLVNFENRIHVHGTFLTGIHVLKYRHEVTGHPVKATHGLYTV
jgi:hypothetical protein